MTKRFPITLIAILMATHLTGCGPSDDIAWVEGTVKMDGEPLADATVVFVPEVGRPAGAATDDNGHYVLNYRQGQKGAPIGKCKVRIFTQRERSETPDGKPIPAVPERVPMQYNAQTTLEFTVEAGKKNVADFDISSEGQVMAADTYE